MESTQSYYPTGLTTKPRSDSWVSGLLWLNGIALILLVMIVGDKLLAWRPAQFGQSWSLLDPPIHILLAALVASPLILSPGSFTLKLARLTSLALAASMIDLDHAIVARSFNLYAVTHIHGRPVTHSLAFALICAVIVWVLIQNKSVGWLVLFGITSHVIRDASTGGTPYLFPLQENIISMEAYWMTQIGLYVSASLLVWLHSLRSSESIPEGFAPDRRPAN